MTYHRSVRVGREICKSTSPTSLPREGQLGQITQLCVRFGMSLAREAPLQPVPVHFHQILPHAEGERLVLSFMPMTTCSIIENH